MKILIGTLLILSTTITSGLGQTKTFIDQPYVEVTGHADTLVTPNQIFIKIIITEKDTRDKIPLEETERKMIEAFNAMNIKTAVDLTTSDMLSNYKFYLLKHKDILKSKEYMLKVSDAATASKVFIKLEDLEISNTSIDRTDHTDYERIENLCRAKAIENAMLKAIAMTKPIMQGVGAAIHISDRSPDIDRVLQGRAAGVSIRGYSTISNGHEKYEPPKIEFEKIKIQADINVTFILK